VRSKSCVRPNTLHVLDMKAGQNREPADLALNPMGKVPAILHGDVLVTEQVAMSPYGSVESTVQAVIQQLSKGPWMLGEKFTAVDVLWGTALSWMTGFGLMESVGPVKAYVERWNARPVVKTVAHIDSQLLAARQTAP
jgi:glutathione S-transferase